MIPIKYPPLVKYASDKPIQEFLKLNEDVEGDVDTGKKGKKEAPKKGKGGSELTEEPAYDEHGRPLPRIFVDTPSAKDPESPPDSSEVAKTEFVRGFLVVDADAGELSNLDSQFLREVDPLMCSCFELIRRYSATLLSNADCPYLWRAIHPQLPDGRPCYNPAGKYCVKLFVAGAWRKVYVNDHVPISESGEPVVASSAVPQELWPMILAKAVYTVYTALGYFKVFHCLGMANAAPSSTDTAAAFIAFALHTLTGWLSTAPMAIPSNTEDDMGSFLQDIAFGGCRCISLPEKIRSEALHSKEIEVDESKYEGKLTAKIIRDLQETKKVRKEHLKRVICKREKDIRDTIFALNNVHAEFFCFVVTNPEGTKFKVNPILTIASDSHDPPVVEAYSPGSPTLTKLAVTDSHVSPVKLPRPVHNAGASSLSTVQLLVDWALTGVHSTGLEENSIENNAVREKDPESNGIDEKDQQEWLNSTEVYQKWIPFSEFCDSMSVEQSAPLGVSVVSFETRSRTPVAQQMHWGWKATDEPVSEATGKGKAPAKGKDKKNNADLEVSLTPLGVPVAGVDQGLFSPTLLHVNVNNVLEKRINGQKNNSDEPGGVESPEIEAPESNIVASVEVPNPEPAVNLISKPDPSEYVAVMVHLQGEVLESLSDASGSTDDKSVPLLADNIVVVLQEIREDQEEPLVMRVELPSSSSVFPVTRTTFHIPVGRIAHSPNGGNLSFWVRVFTKASVHITVASSCPLILGPAETVWETSGEGVVSILDGESSTIRANLESVLFRTCFLAPDPKVISSAEVSLPEGCVCENVTDEAGFAHDIGTEKTEQIANDALPASVDLLSSFVGGNRVLAFLFISDRRASHYMSLIEVSGSYPEQGVTLPRLDGNILRLVPASSASGPLPGQLSVSLVGKCFIPQDTHHLTGFKWKLILLSRKNLPLTNRWTSLPPPSSGPTIPAVSKRYAGCYTPNNKLVLFRDEISGVLADAPIAIRISLLPISFGSESSPKTQSDIWLKIRLINPRTRDVIREYRGREVFILYTIDLKQFVVPEEEATPSPAKGKKDEKKKGGATEVTVNFIMECVLDENSMDIPATWRSRFPYTYSGIFPMSFVPNNATSQKTASQGSVAIGEGVGEPSKFVMPEGALPPSVQGPEWVIDIIGGVVNSISNDLYDILRFKDIKNSWLEKSSDRFDRGTAAMAYNAGRLLSRKEQDDVEDEIVGQLETALDSNVEVLKPLEALLQKIAQVLYFIY